MNTITPDPKPSQRKSKMFAATENAKKAAAAEVATKPAPPKGPKPPRRSKLQVSLDNAATENAIANLAPQETTSANIAKVASDLGITKKRAVEAIAAANTKAGLAATADAARRAIDAEDATIAAVAEVATPAVNAALTSALTDAAKASAERRAKNAADKAKVKGLNAEESAARKAKIANLHHSFVEAFRGGKTIGQIAAEFVNPDTGKPRSPGAVRNVLIAAGLVKVGEPRAPKFSADALTDGETATITNALGTIGEIAQTHNVSIASLIKAFHKA